MGFNESKVEDEFSSPILKKKSIIDKYNQSMKMSNSIVEEKKTLPEAKA
jgi:hypothetical protein